ncbi:hypothetical protein [Emticicia soli]|uniref:Uncharacterized protein n=1 Tax=Emticicia soli TaxID=2027878 RepID=A0ABW5JCH7_9BACT
MSYSSISLTAIKKSDTIGNYILVHGSIAVNDEKTELKILKAQTPEFKANTLSLELNINSEYMQFSDNDIFVKPFSFIKRLDFIDDYDQIELISNQDHHILIDIEDSEDLSNNFVIESDLGQSIFAVEAKLDKMGSLIVMHKKGSKLKDNK